MRFEYAPSVEVEIEIPRWSFRKVGSTGRVDFISPLPCPFNYGCVPDLVGLEGDLLDAVVMGPRLERGCRVRVRAVAAVGLTDRGLYDDKLICCFKPLTAFERHSISAFFAVYARCKALLNLYRGRPGRNAWEGWGEAGAALARAVPRHASWGGPPVPF